jgi:DNA-binding MarR family transcriptional regulator
MGASQANRSALAYRQALQHPVFIQTVGAASKECAVGADMTELIAVAGSGSDDVCNAARLGVVERMLRFFDVSARWWDDLAPAHAPELAIIADLYVNEFRQRAVAVGDACIAARVPCTSALRSIDRLIANEMLIRYSDPRDSRRKLLALTERARSQMARFTDQFLREAAS